jgi:hypothetical protein
MSAGGSYSALLERGCFESAASLSDIRQCLLVEVSTDSVFLVFLSDRCPVTASDLKWELAT